MRQRIRLTESELRHIIREAVEEELDEAFWDGIKGGTKKVWNDVKAGAQNMGQRVQQSAQNMGQRVQQGVQNAVQGVNNYMQDVKAAGQQASNVADAQTAIKTIQGLVQKGILGQNIANMVVGNLQKYGNQ